MKRWAGLAAVAIGLAASGARAQSGGDPEPRFCVNRPSLVDTPCTIEPGHVMLEVSAIDWTLDRHDDGREDTILSGDAQLRIGIADHAELQLSWTAYGHDRQRDAGGVQQSSGVGDVRVGLRRNLLRPDGKGFSVSLEPYVTVPVGGSAIGAGDWGYGIVMPVNYDLSDKLSLQVMGSLDGVPDEDRSGQHLSYTGNAGLGVEVSDQVTLVGEVQIVADRDPLEHTTQSTAAVSIAWQPHDRLQLDALIGAGLNRDTPDLRLLTGGAVLF